MKLNETGPAPEGPFDDKASLPMPHSTMLIGDIAVAYEEFKQAAASLESKHKAYTEAQERYRSALGRFTRLSVGAGTLTAPAV